MGHGGARNRSGPPARESSGRSDRRGYVLTALPAGGYTGRIPAWPLAVKATPAERKAWNWAWRTPQACAWSLPSEAWRIPMVAQWAQLHVRCTAPNAPAALFGALYRLEDRLGLSTAGLAEMGWKVAVDELGQRRATSAPATTSEPATPAPTRRLRGGGA